MNDFEVIEYGEMTKRERCRYRRYIARLNRRTQWYHFKENLKRRLYHVLLGV